MHTSEWGMSIFNILQLDQEKTFWVIGENVAFHQTHDKIHVDHTGYLWRSIIEG